MESAIKVLYVECLLQLKTDIKTFSQIFGACFKVYVMQLVSHAKPLIFFFHSSYNSEN